MGGQLFLLGGHFEKAMEGRAFWWEKFIASALIFTVRSWRKFQIWRVPYMLLRATENAVVGRIWPAGRYLPTPVLSKYLKVYCRVIVTQ